MITQGNPLSVDKGLISLERRFVAPEVGGSTPLNRTIPATQKVQYSQELTWWRENLLSIGISGKIKSIPILYRFCEICWWG